MARRSALETTFSRLAIDIRTETPDCWLTCGDDPGQPRDLLDDLLDVDRDRQRLLPASRLAVEPGVLVGDRDADLAGQRIMRADRPSRCGP